jgi:hypothetical protein
MLGEERQQAFHFLFRRPLLDRRRRPRTDGGRGPRDGGRGRGLSVRIGRRRWRGPLGCRRCGLLICLKRRARTGSRRGWLAGDRRRPGRGRWRWRCHEQALVGDERGRDRGVWNGHKPWFGGQNKFNAAQIAASALRPGCPVKSEKCGKRSICRRPLGCSIIHCSSRCGKLRTRIPVRFEHWHATHEADIRCIFWTQRPRI